MRLSTLVAVVILLGCARVALGAEPAKAPSTKGAEMTPEQIQAEVDAAQMMTSGALGPADYAGALVHLRKAADAGHARAQYNLGVQYYQGQGVSQDFDEAAKWYAKSAAQGYAEAEYNLGVVYDKGRGVPKDPAKALVWYRKAAAQAVGAAMFNIGVHYLDGDGVGKDSVEACAWFMLAQDAGWAQASQALLAVIPKLSMDERKLIPKRTDALRPQTPAKSKDAAPAKAATSPAKAAGPRDPKAVDVVLVAAGDRKISVIKEVRAITGFGLKEAKDLVDGAPATVKARVPRAEAEKLRDQLTAAGAKVELR